MGNLAQTTVARFVEGEDALENQQRMYAYGADARPGMALLPLLAANG